MILSAQALEILLMAYWNLEANTDFLSIHSIREEALLELEREDLVIVQMSSKVGEPDLIETTQRGDAHVVKMMELPLPVQTWV